jgi:hypothetical protein
MLRRATVVGVLLSLLLIVPSLSRAGATPDAGERGEALLFGAAIDRFVAKQLPSTFAVRGNRDAGIGAEDVTLVDARYCGATKSGRGRLVGVVRPATSGEATLAALPPLEARDCHGKLDEVARRLAATPDAGAVTVVELTAEWVPSEVRVAIADIATSGEASRPLGRTLARAKAAGPLATADTAGLKLETERGSSLAFDVALSFLKEGVLATLTVACPGCTPAAPRAPAVVPAAPSPDADGVVGANLRLANRVVALFSEDGPLVLDVDRGNSVEIRNIQIAGGDNTLSVRGRATSRAIAETALVQIDSAGSDLKLAEVRADPQLENCAALSGAQSMGCNVRNAARGPAAAALAAAITSRYRGKALRALAAPPPFSFEVGGRRMTLRLTPTRASSTSGNLIVQGKADVE